MENRKCPVCGGEFELGLTPDVNNAGGYSKAVWGTGISGSFFFLKKIENSHEIKSYRCKKCGYLESYAK